MATSSATLNGAGREGSGLSPWPIRSTASTRQRADRSSISGRHWWREEALQCSSTTAGPVPRSLQATENVPVSPRTVMVSSLKNCGSLRISLAVRIVLPPMDGS